MSDSSAVGHVVVVGAGLVGTSIAYRLAQANWRVSIVERGQVGGGASRNSFSWVNAHGKSPREYQELNRAGMGEHHILAAELNTARYLSCHGSLLWDPELDPARARVERAPGRTPYDDGRATIEAEADAIAVSRRYAYPVRELAPEDARTIAPDLVIGDDVDTVYYFPDDGWVDGYGLTLALLGEARRRHGVEVHQGVRVDAIEAIPGGGLRVCAGEAMRLECDIVVNAAGPQAGEVAAAAGSALPVNQAPGLLFRSSPIPHRLEQVVHAGRLSIRPDGGGRLVVRSSAYDPRVDEPPATRGALVDEVACDVTAVVPAMCLGTIEDVYVGVRGIPRDGLPIVGWDAKVDGLYHAVMHSGLTLAPVIGRLVGAELIGTPSTLLETFRPDRF